MKVIQQIPQIIGLAVGAVFIFIGWIIEKVIK